MGLGAWFAVGRGSGFGPAQVSTCEVGSRPAPGGGPHFLRRNGEKEAQGGAPWTPFFKARSLLARSFWRGGAQRGGCWAISEPIYVP